MWQATGFVIVFTLWAMSAELPKCLSRYLAAFLVATMGQTVQLYIWPEPVLGHTSAAFNLSYYIFTSAILAFVLLVVWAQRESIFFDLLGILSVIIGVLLATLLILSVYRDLGHPVHGYDLFYFAESGILTACGTVCFLMGFRIADKRIFVIPGLMWLLQATFRMSFVLNIESQVWLRLNWVVPALIVCAAFGGIGIVARRERELGRLA